MPFQVYLFGCEELINCASSLSEPNFFLFFLLFRQLADDEAFIVLLQTSLFLVFPIMLFVIACLSLPSLLKHFPSISSFEPNLLFSECPFSILFHSAFVSIWPILTLECCIYMFL